MNPDDLRVVLDALAEFARDAQARLDESRALFYRVRKGSGE